MVRQIRPARVYKAVTEEMNNRLLERMETPEPPWYRVMYSVPPSETLTRPLPPQHRQPNPKNRKPKDLYKPQRLSYPEDRLRKTFYRDHPWELARPRVIIESDGKDYQTLDWSKGLRQRGVALSGECVVQRQLWLMENEGMTKQKAYDQTRREFYRLRQEEEIERHVAVEEARYVGGYFGKTRLDVGMQLENTEYENWKAWAAQELAAADAAKTDDLSLEEDVVGVADGAGSDTAAPLAS